MSVKIPDDILQSARMTDEEMRQEIAMLLYRKEKVTLEQACRFAGMTIIQFQHLLAGQGIPLHYDVEEFQEDLNVLEELKRD